MKPTMHVAVLGGGFQGCCTALALSSKGARVTLFDRNNCLLTRAAVANEGKIHLGYVYGGNGGSLRTAKALVPGALAFSPFIARHLSVSPHDVETSLPQHYLVHRDSQRTVDQSASYFAAVHALVVDAAADCGSSYFGRDLRSPPRRLSDGELQSHFDPEIIQAAFATEEIAVEPSGLARRVRAAISDDPWIEVRLDHLIIKVEETPQGLTVASESVQAPAGETFDHVVNALWDGRLAIDATLGLKPTRPWLYRFKYGVTFRLPGWAPPPPTSTVTLGPFGDVVSYTGGSVYLSWYPSCMRAKSSETVPTTWPTYADEPLCSELLSSTLAPMAEFVHALGAVSLADLSNVQAKGGVIVALGHTDIDDPRSGLHSRHDIGVQSHGNYHSVDPGKLTMAPYFAEVCARRILRH